MNLSAGHGKSLAMIKNNLTVLFALENAGVTKNQKHLSANNTKKAKKYFLYVFFASFALFADKCF